jgi:ribosomal protein S18 acetylase RimI-like enzyme
VVRAVTFREYRSLDFRRLWEIDRLCFDVKVAYTRQEMRLMLDSPEAVAFVAESSRGEVIGFAVGEKVTRTIGRIITLDVLPGYRRRGAGRRLMALCERRLRIAGAEAVRLEVGVSNRRAQALYQELGYTFVKRIAGYYKTGEDAWVMEKHFGRSATEKQDTTRAGRRAARAG